MIENVDYSYIYPASDESGVHIKLLTGDFKDTIFKYGKVSFDEKDDQGYLHFDYNVLQSTVMKPKSWRRTKTSKIALEIFWWKSFQTD